MTTHPPASQPWMESALCAQIGDTELWFPDRGGAVTPAKSVCLKCPVREECLAYALALEGELDHSHRFGIYGGLSAKQRYDLARGIEPPPISRLCVVCEEQFPGPAHRLYCSERCANHAHSQRQKQRRAQRRRQRGKAA